VDFAGKEHHLLGYFPDSVWAGDLSPALRKLQAACAAVKSSRETRNSNLLRWLNAVLTGPHGTRYFPAGAGARGVAAVAAAPLQVSAIAAWAREHAGLAEPTALGRPHFRAYLLEVVGVRDDLVFGPRDGDGWATLSLASGAVAYTGAAAGAANTNTNTNDSLRLEALMHSATLARRDIAFAPLPMSDAVALINAAGGRAVIAHLPTLGSDWHAKFAKHIGTLANAGLFGLEAFSAEISAENHALIRSLAEKHQLHLTGGSDNHGSLKVRWLGCLCIVNVQYTSGVCRCMRIWATCTARAVRCMRRSTSGRGWAGSKATRCGSTIKTLRFDRPIL
jgi:hypothetical protein